MNYTHEGGWGMDEWHTAGSRMMGRRAHILDDRCTHSPDRADQRQADLCRNACASRTACFARRDCRAADGSSARDCGCAHECTVWSIAADRLS
jgi:hypothetical protein